MIKDSSWKQALREKRFQSHLFVSGLAVVFLIAFIPYFFNEILLAKPGFVLDDFILKQSAPKDWSWIIFGLIYSSVVLTLIFSYSKPYVILLGIETYVAINLVRMITLYLVTLEPPPDIIPLVDPLITKIAYGNVVYLKDLFFSGHVSTLFLLFLLESNLLRKTILLVSTVVTSIFILWQHVHYSVDVLFAPFFAWTLFYVAKKIHSHHFPTTRT